MNSFKTLELCLHCLKTPHPFFWKTTGFLVDVTKCDGLFGVWDTQKCVMGQWFLFGSIHFASNQCHWLACAHSMPLVCVSTLGPKHTPFLLTISHALNGVVLADEWCCNSTAPTPTVPPSVHSSCAHSPCSNTINLVWQHGTTPTITRCDSWHDSGTTRQDALPGCHHLT